METQTNRNLKQLNSRFKRKPTLASVAKYANISPPHLSNIIAGRRKASPELVRKIELGFRRYAR